MKKDKDPNLIAKIEQAIEKKYGKEAIKHPKAEWNEEKEKEYLEQVIEIICPIFATICFKNVFTTHTVSTSWPPRSCPAMLPMLVMRG